MRRILGWVALAMLGASTATRAQYFGKNRVQYRDFDFSIIRTQHFDVYYYRDVRPAAVDAARMAERAYGRLTRALNHQYRERQPIIVYGSHSEFQQNNLTDISEGVQGVTDPFRHRVMLPFTGSYAEFDHVLQHELVHQFQFDVFARGRVGGSLPRLMAVQPPLWFMEGMAEYLSLGPVDPLTAMWLRDAALAGSLPTIAQLTSNPRIFPYRFGHALMAYIGERWGSTAISELLQGVAASGLESGFRRAIGLPIDRLSEEWHEHVRRRYLPEVAERDQALAFAQPLLTRERSQGGLHVSPALSPDGREIAFFSEGGSFFIDLYLADAGSGKIKRRLVKSAFSTDFESLRFLNSAAAWSRDGRFLAFPAKHGGRDDLVIYDVPGTRVHRRIRVRLAGVANPTWSPDGTRLAFTGLDGGTADLYVINADGTDLRRLTRDPYAQLHPAWSPDGTAIAFATDGGPGSDLEQLRVAPLAIAIYHLDSQTTELLPRMEGTNLNPQWSPDGRALAYVSDRTGTANVFLYEFSDRALYQLTDVFTGVSGITATSPAISWAPGADRLVFTYYEGGDYNVYAVEDPQSLKGDALPPPVVAAASPSPSPIEPPVPGGDAPPLLTLGSGSLAGGARGFRASAHAAASEDPVSIRTLLDRAAMALPDTSEFSFRPYSPTLQVDYVVQPTIGFQRDNFGSGIFGGTMISLSDMLGNRRVLLGGQVNGRIEEAQLLAVYANMAHRTNWAIGYQQDPIFFYSGAGLSTDSATGDALLTQRLERFIIHRLFLEASRPFNRFSRLEYGANAVHLSRAELHFRTVFDPVSGYVIAQDLDKVGLGNADYIQPSMALVFDNSYSRWVGPWFGRRSRFEYAPAVGDWRFHQLLGDYRRYDHLPGPFVLASRTLFFGRFGRDNDQFPIFIGYPELLRGYTSGSYRRNECAAEAGGSLGDCAELNQLIGSRIGVFNAELRFPVLNPLATGLPPLEGALFFDAGIAWRDGSELVWTRGDDDDPTTVRQPLASLGLSLRSQFFGFVVLRGDYAKPLNRNGIGPYWTVSLGPTF